MHRTQKATAKAWYAPKYLLPLLFFCGVEAGLLSLATWQYTRMIYKEKIRTEALNQRHLPPLSAADLSPENAHRAVELKGHFDEQRRYVLENQQSAQGVAGWRVITPFVLENNVEVIVDRGWHPRPLGGGQGVANLPPAPAPISQTIAGVITPFIIPHGWLKGAQTGVSSDIIMLLTFAAVPPSTLPRAPVYVVATTNTYPQTTAVAPPPVGGERHRGYMITWSLLALAVAGLFGRFWLKNRP